MNKFGFSEIEFLAPAGLNAFFKSLSMRNEIKITKC